MPAILRGMKQLSRLLTLASTLVASLTLTGCATSAKPGADGLALLEQACKPGQGVRGVKGSVWLKAQSKEASGQFPAMVDASPERLRLEATNLTGGTEALITVE